MGGMGLLSDDEIKMEEQKARLASLLNEPGSGQSM